MSNDAILVHKQPLAPALVSGKIYQANPNAEKLDDNDFRELNRLGQVIEANLACAQPPLPAKREGGRPLPASAPCYTCRMETMRAMALYLDIHGVPLGNLP